MMLNQARQTALIATLGTEPQVVTVTLDLLIEQGVRFDRVIVIHTAEDQPPIRAALQSLEAEFQREAYHPHVRHYDRVLLESPEGEPIHDIYTEAEAGAVFTLIYRQVLEQKRKNRIVHLNASGGRKGIMIYAMAAAQILFDDEDRLWLLSSTPEFTASRALHRRAADDARLIPIPVLRWSRIPQTLTALTVYDDPVQAIHHQRNLLDLQDRERKEQFLENVLTPTEAKIVETLVRESYLSNDELAQRLHYSIQFITKYLTTIYNKLHDHFGLRDDVKGSREVLIAILAPYFEWRDRTSRT